MRYLSIVLGSIGLLLSVSQVRGQGTDPNFDIALKPFGSYSGGNIDTVNLMNGQLSLNIPLATFPQRGGRLALGFTLRYHNSGAWSDWIPGTNPDVPQGTAIGTFGWDQGFTVIENSGATTPPVTMRNVVEVIPNAETVTTVVMKTTSVDGADHYMVKNNSDYTFSQPSTWYSGDLSGYRTYIGSEIGYSDTSWGETDAKVYGPDGTAYSGAEWGQGPIRGTFGFNVGPYVPTLRQDANGNQITYSYSTGYTDTLGRQIPTLTAISVSGSGCATGTTAADQWQLPGPNNQPYTLTFCFVFGTLSTPSEAQSYDDSGHLYHLTAGYGGLKQILLPNGTSWRFEYSSEGANPDTYNDLTKVTFPTGGTISYTWGSHIMCTTHDYMLPRTLLTRTSNPNSPGQVSSTTTYSYSGSECGAYSTTVTDGAGNDSVHHFYAGQVIWGSSPYELSAEYYSGSGGGRTLMRSVENTYNTQSVTNSLNPATETVPLLIGVKTTEAGSGQQSSISYSYDNNLVAYPSSGYTYYAYPNPSYPASNISFGKQTDKSEYDFGASAPGSLLRETATLYSAFSDPNHAANYLAANLLNLPYQTSVSGPVGETATTTFSYDENSVQGSGITTSHVSPGTTASGNLTTISQAHDGSTITSTTTCPATGVASTTKYFDTGVPYQSFDACGRKTEYAYSTTYAGAYPTALTRYASSSGGASQSSSMTYDLNLGQPLDVTDVNGITTHNVLDCMGRTVETDYNYSGTSSSGKVQYLYNDGVGGGGCSSTAGAANSVTIKQQLDDKRWIQTEVDVDGLGRQNKTLLSHNTGTIYTSTYYDAMGRVGSKSNPSRCSSSTGCTETTAGQTTYQYDALGRLHIQTPPGSNGFLQYDYFGNTVTFTDAASRSWKRISDSLGRLTDVYENPTGLNLHTSYQYDGMSNLTQVSDAAGHTRTFKYDALSRLMRASNPETGPICYGTWNGGSCGLDGYDASGNLVKKTDANGKTVAFSYDGFNNLLSKQYSDATPSECYQYGSAAPNVGRATAEWTQAGACASALPASPLTSRAIQGYNFRGQVTAEQQCVLGSCTSSGSNGLTYQYDLAGNLLQFAVPGATTSYYMRNTYDRAGWPTTVGYSSSASTDAPIQPLSFVLGVSPAGGVTGAMVGAHLGLIKAYDQQFRPTGLEVNPQ